MNTKHRWTVALVGLSTLGFLVLLLVWRIFIHPNLSGAQYAELAMKHVQAFIGLPMAAICSLVLVSVLQQRSGEGISFKGLSFEFTGPSGEVVLWVLCFFTISLSIKMLW